jgi:hypothetical protein
MSRLTQRRLFNSFRVGSGVQRGQQALRKVMLLNQSRATSFSSGKMLQLLSSPEVPVGLKTRNSGITTSA